ncbi:MAG: HD domain-containing protein [Candidatus Eisenbacteria bacterium]|nr:HD domain-containing protein [Candidatus Eisenbacteria bacterium]
MKDTLVEKPKTTTTGRPRRLRGASSRFGENLDVWAAYLSNERADSEETTEGVVWKAVETLIDVSGADGCSVALADWGVEMLSERRNGDLVRKTSLRDTMVAHGTIGHEALRTGVPQAVYEVNRDSVHHYPDTVRSGRYASAACFPLGHRGRSLGVLTFLYRKPRRLQRRDKDLGVILAHSMALAIDNSLLVSEGKQNRLVTVQALIRSLEAKDSETSYHSLRVTQHATVLAEEMGLSPRQVEAVQYGATLHDLGKIGVLGPILNKKGKLDEDELALIRRHPVIGARIVENVDYLHAAVPIIRHHHERWDGEGYPDGIRGEKIPLGARIVSIPDFYDALTTSRPYRPAYSHEKAVRMVRERIGTAFDPDIAKIFLSIQEGWKNPAQ